MKPIKLELCGIHSFKTEQCVDFNQITTGFFGVFGATGSGKSTLLDAITLALYGKVLRAKISNDFITLSKDKAFVRFCFEANNQEYLIERNFKRKKDSKLVDSSAVCYEKINGQFCVCAEGVFECDNFIKKLLGMSIGDFSKCIALPQGQFADFIKSLPSERTELISNVFSLSAYGLPIYNNASAKKHTIEVEMAELTGKLAELEDINPQVLETINAKISELKNNIASLLKELKTQEQKFDEGKQTYYKQEQLKKAQTKLDELLENKSFIDNLKAKHEKCLAALPLCEMLKEITDLQTECKNLQISFDNAKTEFITTEQQYNKLNAESTEFFNNYNLKYNEILDNSHNLNELLKKETEKNAINDSILKLEDEILKLNEKLQEVKTQKKDLSEQVDYFKNAIDNSEELLKEYEIDSNLILQIKKGVELQAQIEIVEKATAQIEITLTAFRKNKQIYATKKDELYNEIEKVKKEYKLNISKLIDSEEKRKNDENVSKFVQKNADFIEILEQIAINKGETDGKYQEIENMLFELGKLQTYLFNLKDERKKIVENIESRFGGQNLISINEAIVATQKKQEQEQKKLDTNIKAHQKTLLEIGLQDNLISETNTKLEIKQEIKNNLLNKIKEFELDLLAYKGKSIEAIQEENNTCKIELENKKVDLEQEKTRLFQKKTNCESELKVGTSKLKEKLNLFEVKKALFDEKLLKNGFSDLETLKLFSATEEQVKAMKKSCDEFDGEFSVAKIEVEHLKKDLNNVSVDLKTMEELELSITNNRAKVDALQQELGKNEGEKERILSKLTIKQELSDKKVALSVDLGFAEELVKLLKGKALAEFVCDEYIDEITMRANSIAGLLLDGKLNLKYNKGEFFVEDNLNSGQERNVTTLSGGETFLISLSLALAISETISASSGKTMDFFFLDEGFGTLDNELCETVISALYKLESKDFKIGIISHVDSLFEKIKSKILVTKTEQEGSIVKLIFDL